VEKRRKKHKTITQKMITEMSSEEIDHIILKSSGIDLIMANKDKLNSLFATSITREFDLRQLITEYVQDEKHKQRNEVNSELTHSRYSLSDIALAIFQTRELARSTSPNKAFSLPKRSSSPELEKRNRSTISKHVDKIIKPVATRSLDGIVAAMQEKKIKITSRSQEVLTDREKRKTRSIPRL
jgi:hypothetical protein